MAIQTVKTGAAVNDGTGDDARTAFTKINQNFTDNANAASRLVGTATGQIPLAEETLKAAFSSKPATYAPDAPTDLNTLEGGSLVTVWRATATNAPPQLTNNFISVLTIRIGAIDNRNSRFQFAWGQNTPGFVWRTSNLDGVWEGWEKPYTDMNTTKDSNGFLKGKSPVTRLFSDRLEHQGNDKELEGIEFIKLGVGDYLLKNTTGFAQEGWYIEMPKDANGNVLVAVVYEQLANNDISVKTYDYMLNKKGRIVPDLETPLDIPSTRWIDLRLQALPQDDAQPFDTDETVANNAE